MVGNRIKQLREEVGLKQDELAKQLSISPSAIGMYETNKREPNNDLTIKIANFFNVSVDYLMGKSDFRNNKEALDSYIKEQNSIVLADFIERNKNRFIDLNFTKNDIYEFIELLNPTKKRKFTIESYAKFVKDYLKRFDKIKQKDVYSLFWKALEELTEKQEDFDIYHKLMLLKETEESKSRSKYEIAKLNDSQFYMCPVYGKISAGQPNWAEESLEGYLPIDPNLMNIVNPEECFFLRVNGQSMNKVIKDKAYALIRKTDFVENGEIAVVLVNGNDATLKKFSKQGDLIILEPMSDDPSYTAQVYNKDTTIKVIGKYIGKMEIN